jgi:hypothetical protein
MLQIHWVVFVDALPCYYKKCTRCGGERFENSGTFRVNANGKQLDVWLVCRCMECKSTWNLSVYERIGQNALGETTYVSLLRNDAPLAMQTAFERTLLARNHVQIDVASLVWRVCGENVPYGEAARVTVSSENDLPLPAIKVIARKLGLSSSCVKRLFTRGMLQFDGNLKKKETGRGFSFLLTQNWTG